MGWDGWLRKHNVDILCLQEVQIATISQYRPSSSWVQVKLDNKYISFSAKEAGALVDG